MNERLKVLVVDDDETTRKMVEAFGKGEPYDLEFANNGREAVGRIQQGDVNIVVTDIRMPEMDGEDVLGAIRRFNPQIPVIIMTSYGTIDSAVHFLKSGAYDYLSKPLTQDVFRHRLSRAVESLQMSAEITQLRTSLQRAAVKTTVIGTSRPIREVMERALAVAQTDASVVVYGESGTGKELIARTIHLGSHRSQGPFVPVNCGALPETLLESELFGYKRGAFTDAATDHAGLVVEASGGTLFLDEIGEITPRVQVKLLRFLQDKEVRPLGSAKSVRVDVRIISATNRDLKTAIAQGGFREDLFYRLNIVPLLVPPLRERKEDIPLLAVHFLRRFSEEFGKEVREISPLAMQKLVGYHWPGNVRELENKIQQMVVMATSSVIRPQDVETSAEQKSFDYMESIIEAMERSAEDGKGGRTFKEKKRKIVSDYESKYLRRLLLVHRGNVSRAARAAGMDRKNFWQLMKKHGLRADEFSEPAPGA